MLSAVLANGDVDAASPLEPVVLHERSGAPSKGGRPDPPAPLPAAGDAEPGTGSSVSVGVSPAFRPELPRPPQPAASTDTAGAPPSGALAPLEIPEIDDLVTRAIRAGRTPGAVVVVGRQSGVVFRRAYGRRAIVPQREDMTVDTIFDLASLTKPLVVGTLVQWLIENGRLDVREPAVKYLPEFGVREKYLVTVEQLLLHTSGLPPSNTLRDYWQGAERARSLTLGGYLYKYPGREFIYSDIGYIALGELIENVTGERLDQTAERVIWKPLGMNDTRYCPELCDDPRIAPTELNHGWAKNPIRGQPSDTRVFRLGGVAGNAGVFSSADDVARYARMLLGEGELDGARVLARERVQDMIRPRPVPKATRALGWDVSSGFSSGRGRELSADAVGHGGYTGTSLWIDPAQDLFVVFLSNRNHPFSTGRVTELQGRVTDAAARALRAPSEHAWTGPAGADGREPLAASSCDGGSPEPGACAAGQDLPGAEG
jgi:CubicO group peptidase (beta-lactamase class C family)